MAYTSLSAILVIVPGLPQTTTAAGYTAATAIVTAHIARADAMINGMIAKRYSVPISPTPPFLSKVSEDITAYYTYRSAYTQDNLNRLEYFAELKDDALNELKLIREGDIDLSDSLGSLITERTTDLVDSIVDATTIDYQTFFDKDDELKWKFDIDELDSISGSR